MPYTYVLYSEKLQKFYVGYCINIESRLVEHNLGQSKFTSRGVPWRLVYQEFFENSIDAKRRERYIKKMKSKKYIQQLIDGAGGRASPTDKNED